MFGTELDSSTDPGWRTNFLTVTAKIRLVANGGGVFKIVLFVSWSREKKASVLDKVNQALSMLGSCLCVIRAERVNIPSP